MGRCHGRLYNARCMLDTRVQCIKHSGFDQNMGLPCPERNRRKEFRLQAREAVRSAASLADPLVFIQCKPVGHAGDVIADSTVETDLIEAALRAFAHETWVRG